MRSSKHRFFRPGLAYTWLVHAGVNRKYQARNSLLMTSLMLLTALMLLAAKQTNAMGFENFDSQNPLAVYAPTTNYKIFRKGKRIGSHSVSFEVNGDAVMVRVKSDIVVTVLKVPVFKFNYAATEKWENGQLIEVNARVTEKGKSRKNTLKKEAGGYRLTNESGSTVVDEVPFSSNHWNPGVLSSKTIFNTLTGKPNKVIIEDAGPDTIKTGSSTIEAHHYIYTGALSAETWYDANGRWVKLLFKGEDGSAIEYVINE